MEVVGSCALPWALSALCALAFAGAPAGRPTPFARPAPAAAVPSVIATPVRSVRTQHGTIGYRSLGYGRPLVLIMGLSGSIDAWQPRFIDALARRHRVIAFDNEGIGSSTLRSGTLTIRGMGDETAALISALHLRRPDVLGWSMGGFIAQSFAARYPKLYRRLILSATAPGNGQAKLPAAAVGRVLAGGGGNILADLFPADQAAEGPAYITAIAEYPQFYLPPTNVSTAQLVASNSWLTGHDPGGRAVTRITAPTLVADGAQDVILPSVNSIKLAHLIPHAELKLYPDAGHGFLFQDESSWVPMIERFLAAPAPARPLRHR